MSETKKRKPPIFKILIGLAVFAFIGAILNNNKTWFSNDPPIQMIPDMDNQFKAKPQQEQSFFADRAEQRTPVAGTVARDSDPYKLGVGDIVAAETENVNTLEKSDFTLARGQNRFNTLCSPCHNVDGKGNGSVVKRGFAPPPDMSRPETQALSDARLFHIISVGQNAMSSYADKLRPIDRWAVVHWIRELQTGKALANLDSPKNKNLAKTK